jgi:hypothetical protein
MQKEEPVHIYGTATNAGYNVFYSEKLDDLFKIYLN